MQKGSQGYLLKNVEPETLLHAIRQVYAGEQYLESSLKEQLLQSYLNPSTQPVKLTLREQQILDLIAQGKTSIEIAAQLYLSYRTIQNNRATLYEKFKVHNTVELIKVALQMGLVS